MLITRNSENKILYLFEHPESFMLTFIKMRKYLNNMILPV